MKKINLNKIALSLPILCNISLFIIMIILLLCSCQNTSRSTEIKTVDESQLDNSEFHNPKVNELPSNCNGLFKLSPPTLVAL